MPTPSPYYGSNYIGLNSGATLFIGADPIVDVSGGYTYFLQYAKLAFGVTGAYSPVSSSNPLPVSLSTGLTATISGFTGTITIQGTPSGTAVPVSGSVTVSGITSAPVYVQTAANCRVEITGGQRLSKLNDSVSIFGPSGSTWIYANLVNSSGSPIGTTANPMQVSFSGVTISATIAATVGVTNDAPGSALRIQGISGGTNVAVTVGNTVGIYDTNILNGMTVTYSQLNAMGATLNAIYNALSVFGLVRPSSAKSTVLSVTTSPAVLGSGFTCSSGVNLKSLGSNTDLIYLGGASVGSSYGYQLEPGEQVFFNVANLNMIYGMSKSGTQTLSYFAS